MKKNILITGGTGFIGRQLTSLFIEKGFSVSILSRSRRQNTSQISYYNWNVDTDTIDEQAVLNADFIVHLAGEAITEKRWTSFRKQEIMASRTESIKLLTKVLIKYNKKPEAFVTASGIGIYGAINGSEICTEATLPENDFIGLTCQQWESAADTVQSLGIRTVKIRTGLVLGKEEGFLKKMNPIFKFRLGAALGSGKQYMPWIHIDDLCAIYLEAIQNETMSGAYNAAVTANTTNSDFSKTLGNIYGYSIWLPNVPTFLIKIIWGEMSKIILTGRRVSSDKIKKTGFHFQFENLESALRDCLER